MTMQRLEQTKPHFHVGTLGHVGDGKTTLTAAMTRVFAAKFGGRVSAYDELDAAAQETVRGISVHASRVGFETDKRRYAHIDCPEHADYVKAMITGASQMDGAILVVSARDGPRPQTREHILLARQVGVPHLIVFLNKCDLVADTELLDLVEIEVRELLSKYEFPGDATPVIRGSAKLALEGDLGVLGQQAILELAEALDSYFPQPERAVDGAFLMPVEDVFSVAGRGTIVTGRIERGVIKVGQEVDIVGLRKPRRARCMGVEMFRRLEDQGKAGDDVGILLSGVMPNDVRRGQVLSAPGTVQAHDHFAAEVYIFSQDEGGRHTPFFSNYRPQFNFRGADVAGAIELPEDVKMVTPGRSVHMNVKLSAPAAIERGLRFAIREGARTIGSGIISALLGLVMQGNVAASPVTSEEIGLRSVIQQLPITEVTRQSVEVPNEAAVLVTELIRKHWPPYSPVRALCLRTWRALSNKAKHPELYSFSDILRIARTEDDTNLAQALLYLSNPGVQVLSLSLMYERGGQLLELPEKQTDSYSKREDFHHPQLGTPMATSEVLVCFKPGVRLQRMHPA